MSTKPYLPVTPSVIDDMDRSKRTLGALEERYTELNKPLQYSESKQKELFEKYMGLKFKLTEDRAISIVFTNINPDDHNQRYVITVDVDEQNQWKSSWYINCQCLYRKETVVLDITQLLSVPLIRACTPLDPLHYDTIFPYTTHTMMYSIHSRPPSTECSRCPTATQ